MDLLMRNALTLKCISKKFPAFVYSTHLVVCLQQRLPGERLLKPHVAKCHTHADCSYHRDPICLK